MFEISEVAIEHLSFCAPHYIPNLNDMTFLQMTADFKKNGFKTKQCIHLNKLHVGN